MEEGDWRTVSISVRADILEKATQQGVDISGLCNRALAGAAGIAYEPREKARIAAPAGPVIIARETVAAALPPAVVPLPSSPGTAIGLHPVINADDPAAVTKVKRTARTPRVRPVVPVPVPGPAPAQESKAPVPVPSDHPAKPATPKNGKGTPKKKGTGPDIRKFVAETILREDAETASITKEALYQAFARWCRERRITQVPDRKTLTVALKNKFAFNEKLVEGEPSWVNIRLK